MIEGQLYYENAPIVNWRSQTDLELEGIEGWTGNVKLQHSSGHRYTTLYSIYSLYGPAATVHVPVCLIIKVFSSCIYTSLELCVCVCVCVFSAGNWILVPFPPRAHGAI